MYYRYFVYTHNMNILSIIVFVVVTLVIFGLPFWNMMRLRNKKHFLWILVGPVLMLSSYFLANQLELRELTSWYIPIKAFSYYCLVIGMTFFGMSAVWALIGFTFKISKRVLFWIILVSTLLHVGVARIQGERVVIKDLVLPAENITRPYNFVHITDLHTGSTDVKHAQKVVNKIKPLKPEFMVITGDFIDEYHVEPSDIAPFKQLDFPIYLITGNHEYYLDPGTIESVIANTDIQLIDDMKIAYNELDIIGVNELETVANTLNIIGGIDESRYSILLDHQPKSDEAHHAADNGIQLMLSGHTHRGQIWPMGLLMRLRFEYIAGLYEIGDMFLYVNQGTGTLGPKMRFGTANEITLITLKPAL